MRPFAPLALAATAALAFQPFSPGSPIVLTHHVTTTDSTNDLRFLADNRRGFVVAKSVVRLRNTNAGSSSQSLSRGGSSVKSMERMPSKRSASQASTSQSKRAPSRKMGPHEIEGRRIGGNIGQTVGGALGGASAAAAGSVLGTGVAGPAGTTFGTVAGTALGSAAGSICGQVVGSWIGGQIGRRKDEAAARNQRCRKLLSVKYAAILQKS
ncbi:hypothetical protein Ae201684P_020331 [Aphanomyces euteiches]|uniref:Glycine zipper domain-containing protein n=1 Tax=Aphanomyces euteiches TaxID=100861 RepID=A0A6G0WC07_9STRA|nr:hypothetical protein Ae201684_016562 [Aphanomyces euteiches]KAH9084071.1 hypothetical protein Ae201684P_020331 [Aphanomyces euteiches]